MYPKLFEIGPVPVYSYGLFLGLAFIIGSIILNRELRRNGYSESVGSAVVLLSLLGGIVGSKIFYVLEEWNFGQPNPLSYYLNAEVFFSPSGLTFYGGLILAIVLLYFYCRSKDIPLLKMFDMMAPAAALGYGIARIGCHLSGDGDYGIPVNGTAWEFLGYSYVNGTVPTAAGVLVHPTPLYELLASVAIFAFLWSIRKKYTVPGYVFAYYLILSGVERLLVEFIRLNPKLIFGLTQAQVISLVMIFAGVLIITTRKKVSGEASPNVTL